MKLRSLIFILFVVLGSIKSTWALQTMHFSQLKLPPGWVLKDNSIPEIPVFIHEHEELIETLAFLEVKKEDRKVIAPQTVAELKSNLEKSVNNQTRYFGSSEWKVQEIEKVPLVRGILFKVYGSYLSAARQKVYFEEWKFYLEQGFAQLTFSKERGSSPRSSGEVESLMKRYAPFGESLWF